MNPALIAKVFQVALQAAKGAAKSGAARKAAAKAAQRALRNANLWDVKKEKQILGVVSNAVDDIYKGGRTVTKEVSGKGLREAGEKAFSKRAGDIHLDERKISQLRQGHRDASERLLSETNKRLDEVRKRIGKGAAPKAAAKGAKRGTQSGAKASQQSYQYGPQTPPPSQSAEYFPQTPPPSSGRMGKLKASGKRALEYAKNNKLAVGGAALSAAFVPSMAESLGTTMGLDPFDYQGRLAKTRNLQALPSVLDAMEQEGELIRQESLNRGLRAGVRPVEMSDPLGDLMQDQELAAILEGKLEQLRGQGVSAQPRRLDPYEIAARLGL